MINPNNIPSNVKIRYIVVSIPSKGGVSDELELLIDMIQAEEAKVEIRHALSKLASYQRGGYNE